MKGTGDDDMKGRMKATPIDKLKENIHISRMLKNDKDNEIPDVEPPIITDVPHITMDCIIT